MSAILGLLVQEGSSQAVSEEFSIFLQALDEEQKKGASYILNKIREGVSEASFSPDHPLYAGMVKSIGALDPYPPGVKEASIYLFQQLLRFPRASRQAQVILAHITQWMTSDTFKNEASVDDPDCETLTEEEFKKIAEQIHHTVERKALCPLTAVPQEPKVNESMVADPRVALYNYFFEKNHEPYDLTAFDSAVEALVSLFNTHMSDGKITEDMLRDDERKGALGAAQSLRDFLTNGGQPSNSFGSRLIKIHEIVREKLDPQSQAIQLASWAIAGHHCRTRSEEETLAFYTQQTYGSYLEGEDDTLEARVALVLAKYREKLLEDVVPQEIKERIHLMRYLKQKSQKDLGLYGDYQGFVDDHEGYAAKLEDHKRYRNMVNPDSTTLKGIVWEEYKNPQKMIDFVKKAMGEPTTIHSKMYERDAEQAPTYYDEAQKHITSQGVRALLYSLGYLE